MALGADVAGVDPVLGERRRRLRVLDQQLVAVVVEVADDRHVHAQVVASLRIISGTAAAASSVLTVTRTSWDARVGEAGDLDRGRVGIGRVRVGHRLDDDGWALPTSTPPTSTRDRRPAPRAGADQARSRSLPPPEPAGDVEPGDPDQEREQEHEADDVGQLLGPEADPRAEQLLER